MPMATASSTGSASSASRSAPTATRAWWTCSPGPDRHRMAVCPARAVALPDGRTAYSFTMFQAPDMPDELFDAQHASLEREFANIEAVFAQ